MSKYFVRTTAASATGSVSTISPTASPASYVFGQDAVGGVYKRTIDILAASIAIVLLSPVFLFAMIAIPLFDGGPVFFSHKRIGFGGRHFGCLKFRTMIVNADAKLQEHLAADPRAAEEWNTTRKLKDDPRQTVIGRALRRSSIDELPQLINVLRGEMSLVGPRPIVRDEVVRYGRDIFSYLSVRPGLTGAWQVSGRSDLSYTDRVRLDVEYCTRWSLMKDLAIMLRTIPALVLGRGSY